MTPKEKAKEIVSKYREKLKVADSYFIVMGGRELALKEVKEILDSNLDLKDRQYWQEVREEIYCL